MTSDIRPPQDSILITCGVKQCGALATQKVFVNDVYDPLMGGYDANLCDVHTQEALASGEVAHVKGPVVQPQLPHPFNPFTTPLRSTREGTLDDKWFELETKHPELSRLFPGGKEALAKTTVIITLGANDKGPLAVIGSQEDSNVDMVTLQRQMQNSGRTRAMLYVWLEAPGSGMWKVIELLAHC